jgi:hypothetical protein
MKAGILEDQCLEGGPLAENLEFLCFVRHWQFRHRVCRAYRGKSRGMVGRPIRCVWENFFCGCSFLHDTDLGAQVQRWLDDAANVRVRAITGEGLMGRFRTASEIVLDLRWLIPLSFIIM